MARYHTPPAYTSHNQLQPAEQPQQSPTVPSARQGFANRPCALPFSLHAPCRYVPPVEQQALLLCWQARLCLQHRPQCVHAVVGVQLRVAKGEEGREVRLAATGGGGEGGSETVADQA